MSDPGNDPSLRDIIFHIAKSVNKNTESEGASKRYSLQVPLKDSEERKLINPDEAVGQTVQFREALLHQDYSDNLTQDKQIVNNIKSKKQEIISTSSVKDSGGEKIVNPDEAVLPAVQFRRGLLHQNYSDNLAQDKQIVKNIISKNRKCKTFY